MIKSLISALHQVCSEQPAKPLPSELRFEPTAIELADAIWLAAQIGLSSQQKILDAPDIEPPKSSEHFYTEGEFQSITKEQSDNDTTDVTSKSSAPSCLEVLPEDGAQAVTKGQDCLALNPANLEKSSDADVATPIETIETTDTPTKSNNSVNSFSQADIATKQQKILDTPTQTQQVNQACQAQAKRHSYFKPEHIVQPDINSNQQHYLTTQENFHDLHTSNHNKPKSQQRARPFKSAAATMLPDPLSIERALRPLIQHIESPKNIILDVEATIQNVAESGIWNPVLHGESECWFELALVIDQSPSMLIWQQTINELRDLFVRHNAFRSVNTWSAVTHKSTQQVKLYAGAGNSLNYKRSYSAQDLTDPQGRRIIIVVTDCVSPIWYNGEMKKLLAQWGQTNSVSLLQTLPRRLWSGSALRKTKRVQLQATTLGAANSKLNLSAAATDFFDVTHNHQDKYNTLKIPVLTIEPKPFASWSKMLAGKGDTTALGIIFTADLDKNVAQKSTHSTSENRNLSARERVEVFFAIASPTAQRLAIYLASVPLTLPVMRLVQKEMLPDSRQIHLAEIFLGGILQQNKQKESFDELIKTPNDIHYDFHAGVREQLLDLTIIPDAVKVIDKVSEYLQHRIGNSLSFDALLSDPSVTDSNNYLNEQSIPFAKIKAEVLQRLGGEFATISKHISRKLTAAHKIPLKDIKRGDVLQGIVKEKKDFGVFINLGGISGLLHKSNIPAPDNNQPNDFLKVGDKVDVSVLKNHENKIELLLLTDFIRKYPIDSKILGKVVDFSNQRLAIHIGDNQPGFFKFTSIFGKSVSKNFIMQFFNKGDTVECKIIDNSEKFEELLLSISYKEMIKNITDEKLIAILEFLNKSPLDTIVTGTVVEVTDRIVTVQLGDKILGSYSSIGRNPKLGDQVSVKIMGLAPQSMSINLSQPIINHINKLSLSEIKEGDILNGKVAKTTNSRADIDIGADNIVGELRKENLSWERNTKVNSILKQGEEITVKVLTIDDKKKQVQLGLKQLTTDPWIEVSLRYPVGSHIWGMVMNITDYGCFIEIEEGIQGLLHESEMVWGKKEIDMSSMVNVGDVVEVIMLSIDIEKHRFSCGVKQLTANPWVGASKRYPNGTRLHGIVNSIAYYGCFVGIGDIEGLVHMSEMIWLKNEVDVPSFVNIGDSVEVMVLDVDEETERLELGMKQCTAHPIEEFYRAYNINDSITGTIGSVYDFGIFVNLENDCRGLVHIKNMQEGLSEEDFLNYKQAFKTGEEIEVIVLGIDIAQKRISLGIKHLPQAINPSNMLNGNTPINLDSASHQKTVVTNTKTQNTDFINKHPRGSFVTGTLLEVEKEYLLVDLQDNVYGYAKRTASILKGRVNSIAQWSKIFDPGDNIEFQVVGASTLIVLSIPDKSINDLLTKHDLANLE